MDDMDCTSADMDLLWGAETSDPKRVRQALAQGANPNASNLLGASACMKAVNSAGLGSLECLAILLGAGANPNSRDQRGRAPLHIACGMATPEAARMLVQAGANIEERNQKGQSALMLCIRMNRTEIILELLALGASTEPDKAGSDGALHFAISLGLSRVAWLLAELGSDIEALDGTGLTCAQAARDFDCPDMRDLADALDARVEEAALALQTPACHNNDATLRLWL